MTSKNQSLVTISGGLRNYAQLVPGTFQHVDQLTKARITNLGLCSRYIYTADGNAYRSGKGSSVLWGITREPDNLVLTHLFDEENSSFEQLVNTGDFRSDQAESATAFEQAEVMDLTKFRLQGNEETYCSLQIRIRDSYVFNGKKFVPPNHEEKKALVRIGFTDEYLTLLADNPIINIGRTSLYVLNPAYVRNDARGETIWRVSWLNFFCHGSSFIAIERDIDHYFCVLRGVRRGPKQKRL